MCTDRRGGYLTWCSTHRPEGTVVVGTSSILLPRRSLARGWLEGGRQHRTRKGNRSFSRGLLLKRCWLRRSACG